MPNYRMKAEGATFGMEVDKPLEALKSPLKRQTVSTMTQALMGCPRDLVVLVHKKGSKDFGQAMKVEIAQVRGPNGEPLQAVVITHEGL